MADRSTITSSIAKHFAVLKCKAELDQMLKGVESLGLLELIQANPKMMKKLFLGTENKKKLTADLLFNLFPAQFSDEGSNRRDKEERAVMFWDTFNQKVAGTSQKVLHAKNSCSKNIFSR